MSRTAAQGRSSLSAQRGALSSERAFARGHPQLSGGQIRRVLATCARDGTPNVTYVSQVHLRRSRRTSRSRSSSSTRRARTSSSIRIAACTLVDPRTWRGASYCRLRLLRTESSGPPFERMKARPRRHRLAPGHDRRVQAARRRRLSRARADRSGCGLRCLPPPARRCQPLAAVRHDSAAHCCRLRPTCARCSTMLCGARHHMAITPRKVLLTRRRRHDRRDSTRWPRAATRPRASALRFRGTGRDRGRGARTARAHPHHARHRASTRIAWRCANVESEGRGRPARDRDPAAGSGEPGQPARGTDAARRTHRSGVVFVESHEVGALPLRGRGRAARGRARISARRSRRCSRRPRAAKSRAARRRGRQSRAANHSKCGTTAPTTASSSATTT